MSYRTNYITGRTSEFNEFRKGTPVHLEAGGFLLCTAGSGNVAIDSKQYNIKKWDLTVAFPHSYVHALHTTDDFDGVIFGVDVDMLINTEISNKSFYITSITNSPSISLHQEEAQKILALRESFLKQSADTTHPLRAEIDEAILKIIIYEVAALFHNSRPNANHEISRDDMIFNNFIIQLHSETSFNRDLSHFASAQSITTGHLSKVVKRVSNRAASKWINDYTIASIKRLLQNRELPIAEIAETVGFPSASFMSQYFKKTTMLSPKEYRAEYTTGR